MLKEIRNMNGFKDKLINFFRQRYGIDELYKFLLTMFIIIWVLNIFIRSTILYWLNLLICFFIIYRMFSKNVYKRQKENIKFLRIKDKLKGKVKLSRRKWKDRKTHIYRKCPNCKAEIRLPKKKGKHVCTCPNCKKEFNVKC